MSATGTNLSGARLQIEPAAANRVSNVFLGLGVVGLGATGYAMYAGGDKTTVFFMPDGSAQDLNNNINNGVVYLARPGELYSATAITVWGATGRLRGWKLTNSGGPQWKQQ